MTTFIQIHTLQTFAACNLNRGDDGRPKTLVYGGVERLRYSSQALKYALRNSPILRTTLGEAFGTRTKMLGHDVHDHLLKMKVSPAKAAEIGALVTEVCGKIEQYLRSLGTPATVRSNALMVAVLAWGDITYVEGDNFGNVPALGLATYGGKLPTAASWQRVLAEKQILKPTPGRFGAPASSRVVYG